MSLRLRLILLFGSLLVVLLTAAWWWSAWLTRQLTAELDETAEAVGRSVVSVIGDRSVWFGEEDESVQPEVEVLVERVIRSDERTVRALHRQVDDRVVGFSVQVDDAPAQVVELPRMPEDLERRLAELKVHTVRGPSADRPRLRLEGAGSARDIPIPDQGLQAVVDRFSGQLFAGLTGLLGLGLVLAALIAHRVSVPLRALQGAADRVGRGELGVQVAGDGVSEVQATVGAFNAMSRRLAELEGAREALREQRHLSEIGDIGRGLAHSLRNPLNTIGLSIDALADRAGDEDEQTRALAADARRQIRRIDQSIRSFLALADRAQTEVEPVDLRDVVRDVVLESVQQAGAVPVSPELPQQPVTVEGLEAELRAMVQALVVNAVEASTGDDPVTVGLEVDEDEVRVVVADRGHGLAPAIRERLFEPHATTRADGSGMGLYLTRRLARGRYRGEVALNEREGGGVRAVMRLARRRSEVGP